METTTSQQIKALQQQVKTLQAKNLQQFQKDILAQLYDIRTTFKKQIEKLNNCPQNIQSDLAKDKKIEELENQNRKLNYRIQHLVNNLRQARK